MIYTVKHSESDWTDEVAADDFADAAELGASVLWDEWYWDECHSSYPNVRLEVIDSKGKSEFFIVDIELQPSFYVRKINP